MQIRGILIYGQRALRFSDLHRFGNDPVGLAGFNPQIEIEVLHLDAFSAFAPCKNKLYATLNTNLHAAAHEANLAVTRNLS